MKPLIVLPAVKNAHVTREAVDSVINLNVNIILCCNGGDQDIRELFHEYYKNNHNVIVWDWAENICVNPVWNKFMEYFKNNPEYTHIGILSSDVIMQKQFLQVLKNRDVPNELPIPREVDKVTVYEIVDEQNTIGQMVKEGTNGIFIWLNRQQVNWVHPIPEEIKLWYGDNWIHFICRAMGNPTVILDNFQAFHSGSVTLKEMANSTSLIAQDIILWPSIQQKIINRVIELKDEQN